MITYLDQLKLFCHQLWVMVVQDGRLFDGQPWKYHVFGVITFKEYTHIAELDQILDFFNDGECIPDGYVLDFKSVATLKEELFAWFAKYEIRVICMLDHDSSNHDLDCTLSAYTDTPTDSSNPANVPIQATELIH
jgi:hypothetical protein